MGLGKNNDCDYCDANECMFVGSETLQQNKNACFISRPGEKNSKDTRFHENCKLCEATNNYDYKKCYMHNARNNIAQI